ncbi:hypothetical protein KW803_02815 [Candidatus Saccharibacteria bacterium]|nr:hypothetical protein [Candidatus Saccharibacteria bacterium]
MTEYGETYPSLPEPSPEIQATLEGTLFTLNRDNTLIRRFDVGDGDFDFIMHKYSDENIVVVRLSQIEDASLIETLEATGFLTRTDPSLDTQSLEFLYDEWKSEIDMIVGKRLAKE